MLHPPERTRERIMLLGPFAAGKSYAWVQVAEWLDRTQSDAKMFVLDSLVTAERDAGHLNNVVLRDWEKWAELEQATEDFVRAARRDVDWLVVDLISTIWDVAQSHYIETVHSHGTDAALWKLEWRAEGGEGHPLVGSEPFGMNWNIIKGYYFNWLNKVIRFPGHVIVCAMPEQVQRPDPRKGDRAQRSDPTEIIREFGPYGVRPRGEKTLAQPFHTIMLMNHPRDDEWTMTTIRDRRRARLVNEAWQDFVVQYLMNVAGWAI